MKKEQKEKIANAVKGLREMKNTLTGQAREFADAVVGALETLEASEEEHDVDEVLAEIDRLRKDYEATRAEDTERVDNALQTLRNQLAAMQAGGVKKNHLTRKVANEVASAILRAHGKDTIADAVGEVLKKNGITGLEAAEVVDYAIEIKVEYLNPLYRQFKKVPYTKFFYTEADLSAATAIAKQWLKGKELTDTEKKIQQLDVTPKTIVTDYIYKRQQVAFKDLDDMERAGSIAEFLQFISNELYQMIVDTIVMHILVKDTVNAQGDEITTFESLVDATTPFITTIAGNNTGLVAFLASLGYATPDLTNRAQLIAAMRYASDRVFNPRGKHKVGILNATTLTTISAYRYADGGDVHFRSREEVAAQLGVDEIFTTDLLANGAFIAMLPDGYWVNEQKAIEVAYPTYEKNVRNFQKEINAGGAVHDLYSVARLTVE